MSKKHNLIVTNRFIYKGGKVGPYNPNTLYDIRHISVERSRKFLLSSLIPNGEIYRAVKIIWSALLNVSKENTRMIEEIEELKQENYRLKLGK